MCGICGMIETSGGVRSESIQRMADQMTHRGPDDAGYYLSPNRVSGLGHRRLSIIDLEGGHQPARNEDGTIHVVFNGEIYNSFYWPEIGWVKNRFITHSTPVGSSLPQS